MSRKQQQPVSETSLLNKPGIIVPKPSLLSSFCFFTVLLLLAWAAAFGCFTTAFELSVNWTQLSPIGVFFALVCTGQFLCGQFLRRKWIPSLCTLLVWGLALWYQFENVLQGALRIANIMLSAYSERLNLRKVLPKFPVEELTPAEEEYVMAVFTVFLMFLFFWLLSWLFIRRQSLLGTFGLTGLFLLSHLGFSILPDRWAFGLLLVFWAFLLLMAPSLRQRRLLVEDGTSFQSSGEMFLHPISLMLLPILALSLLLIYTLFPPETYARPEFVVNLRTQLNSSLNLQTLFRDSGGTGHRNRVDFSNLGSQVYTGRTELQVKHEWQNSVPSFEESPVSQKDYLKSFVGSVYTGASWERLSSADVKTVRKIWGEQSVLTLPADLMQSIPMDSDPHFSYYVSVRKLNGASQSVYAPYGLYSPLGAPNNMEFADDGFLRLPYEFSDTAEYALSAVATPTLDNLPTYKDRLSAYLGDLAQSSSLLSLIGAETPKALSNRIKKSLWKSSDGDQWHMPSWMKELLPAETISGMIEPLEQYNDFVYSHYTQVPDDLRIVLENYAAGHGLSPELAQEDRLAYLRQVKQVLAEKCTYSGSPPVMPQGSDFVAYFLNESRTGYCVHFATAATMLLRAAGIPARYAEGFAVPTAPTADSALDDGSGWVSVADYSAHAWVEVYWGGIGWIPVEMTPAGDSVPAAYANAIGPSESDDLIGLPITSSTSPSPSASSDPTGSAVLTPSLPPLPTDRESSPTANSRTSPSPSPSPGSNSKNNGGSSADPSIFGMELLADGRLTFFGFLFLLLLLVLVPSLLIWTQRLIRLLHRRRLFRQKDRNKAALCVYAHLRRLYWENRLLPHGSAEPPEEIEELALKARFSNHTLTEEELSTLTDQAAAVEKKLKAGLPRAEWLKCKYLRILF